MPLKNGLVSANADAARSSQRNWCKTEKLCCCFQSFINLIGSLTRSTFQIDFVIDRYLFIHTLIFIGLIQLQFAPANMWNVARINNTAAKMVLALIANLHRNQIYCKWKCIELNLLTRFEWKRKRFEWNNIFVWMILNAVLLMNQLDWLLMGFLYVENSIQIKNQSKRWNNWIVLK